MIVTAMSPPSRNHMRAETKPPQNTNQTKLPNVFIINPFR